MWEENDNQSMTEQTKNVTIYGVCDTFGRERVAGLIRPGPQRHLSSDTFATRPRAATRWHIFLVTHSSCGNIGMAPLARHNWHNWFGTHHVHSSSDCVAIYRSRLRSSLTKNKNEMDGFSGIDS